MVKGDYKDFALPRDRLLGIYRSVVESNDDPLKAGRCRVRVFGVHSPNKTKTELDGIPTEELPWAQPCLSLFEGSISSYGLWTVPLQGSHVFVFFENGNILQPRFFASAPGNPTVVPDSTKGFNDPIGKYPDRIGQPDWDQGTGTYPHNIVFHVHGGHTIEIDSTPENERLHIQHKSGTDVLIDKGGNIIIHGVNDEIKVIDRNETINIGGSSTETIASMKIIKAAAAVKIDSPDTHMTGNVHVATGVTGNFTTTDPKYVTVVDGIVTGII